MSPFCSLCGMEYNENQKFCSGCGNTLPKLSQPAPHHKIIEQINPMDISAPSPIIYIKWDLFHKGKTILYDAKLKKIAEIYPEISESGLFFVIQGINNGIDISITHNADTQFYIFQKNQPIAIIEEHLVQSKIILRTMANERIISTDLRNFAIKKTIHTMPDNRNIAEVFPTKSNEYINEEPNCFTLRIKKDVVDFLQLLAMTFVILFRYR